MKEATVDLQRMRASNILKQGLILPRRVTIKECIQISTLQEYACVEPDGVWIGKERWPGGEESTLSKPLKRWADKILQTIEEVWEADNGQTCGKWEMDAEPMDHALIGKQHETVKGIFQNLEGMSGRERLVSEKEGVLRLAALSREAVTRHRIKIIEGGLDIWLKDKIDADTPRGWEEPFSTLDWDAEGGAVDTGSESEQEDFQSQEGSEDFQSQEDGDWGQNEEGLRQVEQEPESIQANQQAQRERMEEEAGQKCKVVTWTWDKPITPQCILVIRHDGDEPISDILDEGADYITTNAVSAVEAFKQTVQGQPRTIMADVTVKGQGKNLELILQLIPKEQVIANLGEEERKKLARDLLKELVEVTQAKGPQECELRFIKASDSITKIMAEKDEEMPWKELQHVLPAVQDDILRNLLASREIALGMQQ